MPCVAVTQLFQKDKQLNSYVSVMKSEIQTLHSCPGNSLFHTTNPNTVRHIGQFRTENLLLYIKEIICTTKNLTAKMLAKAFLFSTKFCSLTEELSELLGKQVWFCNPRHSLLAKNIQSSSYPERKGCFTVACLQDLPLQRYFCGDMVRKVSKTTPDKRDIERLEYTIPWTRKTAPDESSCQSSMLKQPPSKLANISVHGFS